METELLQISNEAFILSFVDFTNADSFTQQSTEWLVNINISSTVRFICYNKHFHRKRGVNLIFLRQHLHCNEVNENENGFFLGNVKWWQSIVFLSYHHYSSLLRLKKRFVARKEIFFIAKNLLAKASSMEKNYYITKFRANFSLPLLILLP